jgi:glucosamine 6-phosphate synthetase-like amidotransferase/phosphosugar isomerase protein
MTIEEQNAILAKEYAEAVRYMDNAEKNLTKARKDGNYYADKKYIRTACGTAYNGVLIALEAWLKIKGVDLPVNEPTSVQGKKKRISQKPRISIGLYKSHVAKLDGKMLSDLDAAYNVLHLDGYYDGITRVKTIESGFDAAYDIINKIKPSA